MKSLFAALLLALLGCGVQAPPKPAVKPACQNGFVNETKIATGQESDPYLPSWTEQEASLWILWRAAQVDLATNPVCYLNGHCGPPLPEALSEQPRCQEVVEVEALPGIGFICDRQSVGGCVVGGVVYCASYNCWRSQYEMENGILCRFGKCEGR